MCFIKNLNTCWVKLSINWVKLLTLMDRFYVSCKCWCKRVIISFYKIHKLDYSVICKEVINIT